MLNYCEQLTTFELFCCCKNFIMSPAHHLKYIAELFNMSPTSGAKIVPKLGDTRKIVNSNRAPVASV